MTAAALLALTALAAPARAWTWGAPPDHVVIGTPVTLSAAAPELGGTPVLASGQKSGAFEVTKVEDGADGAVTVTVMAFALGRQSLPALTWAAGGREAQSPPLELTVVPPPPRPDDNQDIRDIRGPYAARMAPWWTLLALLAA
ncbi:MAG: hypothetical protein KGL53_06285, partial [Elusimicrobia bacterium]|nr:hypothetical protein [Elusimicrobiota bacterium]